MKNSTEILTMTKKDLIYIVEGHEKLIWAIAHAIEETCTMKQRKKIVNIFDSLTGN